MRDALKTALTPDAGSPAAPASKTAQQQESERKAALAQAQGEIERKYGHLTKLDPAVLQRAIEHSTQLTNPQTRAGFIANLIGELMQNPQEATALKGLLSPHFAAPVVPTPADDAEPQIYVRGDDGNVYIDPKKFAEREAWRDRQLKKAWQDEIAPLKQTAKELELEKQAVALDKEVTTWTGNIYGYIKSLPDYEANRSEIGKAFDEDITAFLAQHPKASPEAIENVAIKAYNRVTAPKAAQSAQARVQATLKAKAEGRTASPNGNQKSSVAAQKLTEAESLRAALKEALVDPSTGQMIR